MATVARPPVLAATLVSTAAAWWLMGASASIVRAQPNPSLSGAWSAVQTWPIVSVHASLLPTGKVIFYPYTDDPRLWDPSTGSIVAAAPVGYNIFCSGLTLLADGKLFVAGGHISNNVGLNDASIYDSQANTWARQPDMNAGRWYPTTTTLADGSVLVVSGDVDTTVGMNLLPQVWTSGAWRDLSTAQLSLPRYPFMLLAPDGRVFDAGPEQTSRYLDTSGTGGWTNSATSTGGFRDYGTAVMYEPGKVLLVGGNDPPIASAEKIDLNLPVPTWQSAGLMHTARRQLNATLLPDGTVLVTGGSSGAGFNNAGAPVFTAERWDPAQNTFTELASATRYRGYHSIALLLPDGRVLSSGGDNEPNAEVFSPPYLFNGARPVVTSFPSSITYGDSFFVDTPDAASITAVTLVRLSAVTHAYNMNQRFLRLAFSQAPGGLTVTAPSVAEIAPPGHYMLFVLNAAGVPSIAPIVRLTSGAAPTVSVAATDANAAEAGLDPGTFTLSRTQNMGPPLTVSFVMSGSAANGSDYQTIGTSVTIPSGASSTPVTVTPINDTAVESNEAVTLTLGAGAGYRVGTPAAATVTIVSDDVNDLVESALTAPAVSGAGSSITVSDTAKNQGNSPAVASVTQIYLSSDTLVDTADVVLASRNVPSLAAGATSKVNTVVAIPPGTATKRYYLLAKADATGLVSEVNEANNGRSRRLDIGPDLQVPSVAAPSSAARGATIQVTVATNNRGGAQAGASTTRLYYSDNSGFGTGDVLVATIPVSTLNAGQTSSNQVSVTIPATAPTGTRYLIAISDAASAVLEFLETNNRRSRAITIQ